MSKWKDYTLDIILTLLSFLLGILDPTPLEVFSYYKVGAVICALLVVVTQADPSDAPKRKSEAPSFQMPTLPSFSSKTAAKKAPSAPAARKPAGPPRYTPISDYDREDPRGQWKPGGDGQTQRNNRNSGGKLDMGF